MSEVLTGDPRKWTLARRVSTAAAIGVFDGVHRGHRTVLERLVRMAEKRGLAPAVLTFDPHPLEIIDPARAPKLLMSIAQRIETLGQAGIEIVGVLPFEQVREMDPEVFAREVLGERFQVGVVAVGTDFRFGRDRAGDVDTMRAIGAEMGYEVVAVDLLDDQTDAPISSTRIRSLLATGDIGGAEALLGHHFELCGIVVEGDRRGRTIGFPTANLAIEDRMVVPGNGVYAAWASVHDHVHPAVVNIGVRPTFDGTRLSVEAHLLDFDGDLYGKGLALRFVARLRSEEKFGSVDELVAQIKRDIVAGREALGDGV
jgi:riboflavin kinase/FMN adenylyltransferase